MVIATEVEMSTATRQTWSPRQRVKTLFSSEQISFIFVTQHRILGNWFAKIAVVTIIGRQAGVAQHNAKNEEIEL